MAGMRLKYLTGFLVTGSLLVSSTVSAAATSVSPTPQVSPWATLSALSGGAPAAAVCGAAATAAAAAQAPGGCVLPVVDAPPPPPVASAPPPPPLPVPAAGYGVTPLLLGLVAIAAAVGFWAAVKGNGHHTTTPVSPG
jgi:hypothetical protein